MKKFSLRINDLEVRSCGKQLLSDDGHNRAEIVKWFKVTDEKECCMAVAYWREHSGGYNLQFIGDRAFKVDAEVFMVLAKHGQDVLDYVFSCRKLED